MWCTCCGEGIVLVIWGAGVWEETFRMSDLIWCSPEEWQVTETALSGTWGVSSAGVCWMLLWFGVLGVELVFNSVSGFSGGVSCPSEVRVFTVLWEWGEQCCLLRLICSACHCLFVWQLVRLNLVPLSFPTSGPPLFVGRTLSPSFPSASVSQNAVVFLFLCGFSLNSVSLESWWLLSSIPWADCSRVSFVAFPWSFHTSLAGSTICPMTYPSVVQVSVDVHAVHPSVIPLFRSGVSVWVSFSVGRGCIPLSVWWLSAVLALGAP